MAGVDTMIEQVTVEEAVKRGTVGWHYCMFRPTGHYPVSVSKDTEGVYWLLTLGATEAQPVPAGSRVWALPVIEGGIKP